MVMLNIVACTASIEFIPCTEAVGKLLSMSPISALKAMSSVESDDDVYSRKLTVNSIAL